MVFPPQETIYSSDSSPDDTPNRFFQKKQQMFMQNKQAAETKTDKANDEQKTGALQFQQQAMSVSKMNDSDLGLSPNMSQQFANE